MDMRAMLVELEARVSEIAARLLLGAVFIAILLSSESKAPGTARGQETPNSPPATFVGQLGGLSMDLAAFGEHFALVGMGPRLLVVDLSKPESPRWVGLSPVLGGAVQAVVIQGERAYVAMGWAGVAILDLSRPTELTLLSEPTLRTFQGGCESGAAQDLALHDGRLFVARSEGGLSEFDLSDPIRPRHVACLVPGRDGHVGGRHLVIHAAKDVGFLVDDTDHGWILDLSVAGEPRIVSRDGFRARDLALDGDRLIGIGPGGILNLWAISGPEPLRPLSSLDVASSVQRLAVSTDRAWLGTASGQVMEVDLTDPAAPRLAERMDLPVGELPSGISAILPLASGSGNVLALYNGAVDGPALLKDALAGRFCGEGSGGLAVLDPAAPQGSLLGSLNLPGCRFRSMALTGGRTLWLASRMGDDLGSNRILAFDVSDPAQPRPLGELVLPGNQPVLQLVNAGTVLAILSLGHVYLISPAGDSPRIIGRLEGVPADRSAHIVADPRRDLLVVASEDELVTADDSDPGRPRILGRLDMAAHTHRDRAIDAHLAGLFDLGDGTVLRQLRDGGLLIVDVRDPEHPRPARLWEEGIVERGVVKDGWFFRGIGFVDLRHRSEMRKSYRFGVHDHGKTIIALGPWLLTLDSQAFLHALDVRDPATVSGGWIAPEDPMDGLWGLAEEPWTSATAASTIEVAGGLVGALDHAGLIFYRLGPRVDRSQVARLYLPIIPRNQARPPSLLSERRLERLETWTARPLDKGRALLAEGGRVYVGVDLGSADESAVAILDARSGPHLELMGISSPLGKRIDALALGSRGLYVASLGADDRPSLALLDVADPVRIRKLGEIDLDHSVTALATEENRVYSFHHPGIVASEELWNQGVQSFDFSDPTNPRLGPQLGLSGDERSFNPTIAIGGGRLYVPTTLGFGGELEIFDLRSGSSIDRIEPDRGAELTVELLGTDLVMRGHELLMGSVSIGGRKPAGLWHFDLSNPDRPLETDSLSDLRMRTPEPGRSLAALPQAALGCFRLAWDGDTAYCRHDTHLQAFSVVPGTFAFLDETVLAPDTAPALAPNEYGFSRSLIAPPAGRVFAPTDEGLATYRLGGR